MAARTADGPGRQAGAPDPRTLARQLHLLYDGAATSARMDRDAAAAVFAKTVA